MTQIMLSVRPEWAEKILNGTKTVEIRKSVPKELPCEVYIYVTKNKSKFRVGCMEFANDDLYILPNQKAYKYGCSVEIMGCELPYSKDNFLNGIVVAKFTLNKADTYYLEKPLNFEITYRGIDNQIGCEYSKEIKSDLLKKSCLTFTEMFDYGKKRFDEQQSVIRAWHIDDLVIFDRPKELNEFSSWNFHKWHDGTHWIPLTKAPQSWQYVKGE